MNYPFALCDKGGISQQWAAAHFVFQRFTLFRFAKHYINCRNGDVIYMNTCI
jgi:hypothetical protein